MANEQVLSTEKSIPERADLEKHQRRLRLIAEQAQREKEIQMQPLPDEELAISILMKVPILCALCNRLKLLGTTSYQLANLHVQEQAIPLPSAISSNSVLLTSFNNLGLITAAANFLTLPMLFLACKILKKPSPVTLTTFGEWIYSAVLLTLAITAVAAPITAPFIGAALILMGLGYSTYLLDKFLKEKKKLPLKISLIEQELNELEALLSAQKNSMFDLQSNLQHMNAETLMEHQTLITECTQNIEQTYQSKAELLKKKMIMTRELEAYNEAALMDYCIGVAVSSTLVLGLCLSLFFPPVGFLITTTATCMGAGYLLGRFAITAIKELHQIIHSTTHPDDSSSTAKIMSHFKTTKELDKEPDEAMELKTDRTISLAQLPQQEIEEVALEKNEEHRSASLRMR